MALKDQIHIYSVDTSTFATEEEKEIYYKIGKLSRKIFLIDTFIKDTNKRREKLDKKGLSEEDERLIKRGKRKGLKKKTVSQCEDLFDNCKLYKDKHKSEIKTLKLKLKEVMSMNNLKNMKRTLNENSIKESSIIAVFDSSLTRAMDMTPRLEVYDDIIIVQIYYFEVAQDLVMNGFYFKGEKYSYYASSAGQIKAKKAVFIKEDRWMKYDDVGNEIWSAEGKRLMCGLTFKEINEKGGDKGINPNKFNSYLSLNNSATDTFKGLSIDEIVVVNDFETIVNDVVDFIHTDTFEIEHNKLMDVPINQMDGCGIILPEASDKAFMVRAPFIKGLLVPFQFIDFIKENNASPIIKDIYGKEWNVIDDKISCIMTKSQFKLSKYYDSWDDYKKRFKENNCEISYAHEEEDYVKNSRINYQMLQTLSDMTDDEIEYVTKRSKNTIMKVAKDKDTIFKLLGITEHNIDKNYLQKSIEAYPPLVSDAYTRKVIKQVKDKYVKEAKGGKVEISGKYLFMIPDLFAFCEHLFLHIEKPNGILKRGDVSCNVYAEHDKLACLRAPHLYREWGIRNNVNDELTKKWFISNGLYMSSDDLLSKLVMNDWDSDKSLVCADKKIISIAERHMQDINPVYYEMPIATASELSLATRYKGLIDAFKGGGIGMYSNHISKIWNDESGEIELDLIRYLVMVNNFQIDYSKTLFKVTIPKDINKRISAKTKKKLPHFFKYAKDKENDQIEQSNDSTMNRICDAIPNPRINFKNTEFGEFDYRMLMSRWDFERKDMSDEIIELYNSNLPNLPTKLNYNDSDNNKTPFVFIKVREELLGNHIDDNWVVDTLVYYLYEHKPTEYKLALWSMFGDYIYNNLVENLKTKKTCERCGKLIERKNNKIKYCDKCQKDVYNQQSREKALRYYHKTKNFTK